MPDRRDPDRVRHAMFELVMARASAIACGYADAIDLDRLRHDPLLKVAVGRCPQTGAPLASQSTISQSDGGEGLCLVRPGPDGRNWWPRSPVSPRPMPQSTR